MFPISRMRERERAAAAAVADDAQKPAPVLAVITPPEMLDPRVVEARANLTRAQAELDQAEAVYASTESTQSWKAVTDAQGERDRYAVLERQAVARVAKERAESQAAERARKLERYNELCDFASEAHWQAELRPLMVR